MSSRSFSGRRERGRKRKLRGLEISTRAEKPFREICSAPAGARSHFRVEPFYREYTFIQGYAFLRFENSRCSSVPGGKYRRALIPSRAQETAATKALPECAGSNDASDRVLEWIIPPIPSRCVHIDIECWIETASVLYMVEMPLHFASKSNILNRIRERERENKKKTQKKNLF